MMFVSEAADGVSIKNCERGAKGDSGTSWGSRGAAAAAYWAAKDCRSFAVDLLWKFPWESILPWRDI